MAFGFVIGICSTTSLQRRARAKELRCRTARDREDFRSVVSLVCSYAGAACTRLVDGTAVRPSIDRWDFNPDLDEECPAVGFEGQEKNIDVHDSKRFYMTHIV